MKGNAGFWALFAVMALFAYVAYELNQSGGGQLTRRSFDAANAPRVELVNGEEALVVKADRGGSFLTQVNANGALVDVLIDTGASFLTLTHGDAVAAGLRTDGLRYNQTFSTANGEVEAAQAELDMLAFGSYRLYDVTVFVLPPEKLRVSLLGMNVLRELGRVEFNSDELVIRPN